MQGKVHLWHKADVSKGGGCISYISFTSYIYMSRVPFILCFSEPQVGVRVVKAFVSGS